VELAVELINRVKKGDRRAQRALYDTYSAKMYGVCLRYFPKSEVAKDILHDGFIKVFTSISSFRGDGSLEGWIRRIIVNTALEHIRKSKGYNEVELKNVVGIEAQSLINDLDMPFYLKIVDELPPQYKLVFNLYAIDDFTHAEIAELLGITVSTSKSNYSRAKAILRKRLKSIVDRSYV